MLLLCCPPALAVGNFTYTLPLMEMGDVYNGTVISNLSSSTIVSYWEMNPLGTDVVLMHGLSGTTSATYDYAIGFPAGKATPWTYTYNGEYPGEYLTQWSYGSDGFYQAYGRWHLVGGLPPANVSVIFDIAESGDHSVPISGALITLSNGQFNTTGADGRALIIVVPPANTYTYTISKSGYFSIIDADLGNLGLNGGTAYLTLAKTVPGIPPGYTRTTVHAQDATMGSQIAGATLNLRDVQNNTWVNSTADADGELIIDVQNGHTLDIYASYPGVYTASQELGAIAGGNYYIQLFRPPLSAGPGNVNLLVAVYESTYHTSLAGATVSIRIPSGAIDTTTTGSGGSASFVTPNKTVTIITASKTGYLSKSWSVTTGDFADQLTTVSLSPYTATTIPTATKTAVIPTATATGTIPGGNYTGFWGPLAEGLTGMGAEPEELGILLAAMFIFVGFCIGGWSGSAYSPGAPFNPMGSMAGGVFGFVLATAFGFIPIVWVIAMIFIGIFVVLVLNRG